MIASKSLMPFAKKILLNTSVAAVPYKKNSYHSTTVPAIEAITTRLSPVGTFRVPTTIDGSIQGGWSSPQSGRDLEKGTASASVRRGPPTEFNVGQENCEKTPP